MGVDAGDFDGNGTDDIFVTHLMDETNTLYVNLGESLFEDRTREAGLERRAVVSRVSERSSSTTTTMAGSICLSPTARSNCYRTSCARNIRFRSANRINSFAIRAREVLLKSGRGRRGVAASGSQPRRGVRRRR